ncbi:hypothetical protein HDU86_001408 [Geranomyces michiganensis]|nr:hypothetical protein HDU86_001408 [Geranomyces michiganensis]
MGCVSSKSAKTPVDSNKVVPDGGGVVNKTAGVDVEAVPVASVQAAYPPQPAAGVGETASTPPPGGPVDRVKSAEKLPLGSRSSLDKPLMPPIPSSSSATTNPATTSSSPPPTTSSPPPSLTSSQQNVSAVTGLAAAAKRNGSANKVHPEEEGAMAHTQEQQASSSKPGSAGSDSYVPVYSKAAEGPLRPVAFEIPLGETLFTAPSWKQSGDSVSNQQKFSSTTTTSTVPKLPSLQGLTSDAIAAKLANADRRWKDLDDHELARKKSTRRRRAAGSKPELSSASRPKTRSGTRPTTETTTTTATTSSSTPALLLLPPETDDQLKLRLLEKEAHAERNRKKELEKLTAKLRRMDEHVRSVQERKRVLERGGESEDEDVVMSAPTIHTDTAHTPHLGSSLDAGYRRKVVTDPNPMPAATPVAFQPFVSVSERRKLLRDCGFWHPAVTSTPGCWQQNVLRMAIAEAILAHPLTLQLSHADILASVKAAKGTAFVFGYAHADLVKTMSWVAGKHGIKLRHDLPARDYAQARSAFVRTQSAKSAYLDVEKSILAANAADLAAALAVAPAVALAVGPVLPARKTRRWVRIEEEEEAPVAPAACVKRGAEDAGPAPKRQRLAAEPNEPAVVFACRVFRQLAAEGKITAAQATACRRIVTESPANDLLMSSLEYRGDCGDEEILATIRRLALSCASLAHLSKPRSSGLPSARPLPGPPDNTTTINELPVTPEWFETVDGASRVGQS